MENLKKALVAEYSNRIKETIATIGQPTENQKTPEEALNWFTRWQLDKKQPYKGTFEEQKEKAIKAYSNKINQELKNKLAQVDEIAQAPDFSGELIITVEWKDSRMWRSNPKAYTNHGFEGSSIGGCGYDKLSTATAQALNSDKRILKLLYQKKEDILKSGKWKKTIRDTSWSNQPIRLDNANGINRHFLGYGSGYNILPSFEGGVGVDCHRQIIEGLGLVWQNITSTNSTDVYLIKKAQQ
jgi:hypothetical protein